MCARKGNEARNGRIQPFEAYRTGGEFEAGRGGDACQEVGPGVDGRWESGDSDGRGGIDLV